MAGPSVIVLGGGIAGLAAALALDGAGYRVRVIERASRLEPIGAALSLWPNAIAALARLGIADLANVAAPLNALVLRDRRGHALIGPNRVASAFLPTRAALQDRLLRQLGERADVQLGQAYCDVVTAPDRGTVTMADGSLQEADLVIDASGIWSRTADRLLDNPAAHRGYGGVLALSEPIDPTRAGPTGMATEIWGVGERFGLFDIGGNRRYWFYMRDAAADAPAPSHAECHAIARRWPNPVAAAVDATAPAALIPFTIHARTPPRRLGHGRVICVGDAAHAMEPNLGQGACVSLEDAAILGALARELPAAKLLRAFEHRRLKRVCSLMRQSAAAGRMVHNPRPLDRTARRLVPFIPASLAERRMATNYRVALDP